MRSSSEQSLCTLYAERFGSMPKESTALPASGSDRRYWRLRSADGGSVLGVRHDNEGENRAFVRFSRILLQQGLAVPHIYAEDPSQGIYLIEDLGDTTLLDFLERRRLPDGNPDELTLNYYKQALEQLAFLQTRAGKAIPEAELLPPARFDARVMGWDWHYFKYCFLLPKSVPYDEYELENDFDRLAAFLSSAPSDFFLFRDFQARNILIFNDKTYFIDYQSAKRGALPYDVASLLLQAKARLSPELRQSLLEHYLRAVRQWEPSVDETAFYAYYRGFSLLRLLQVLGAYGFKGYLQGKPHFLQSIEPALENLRHWLSDPNPPVSMPHLHAVLRRLAQIE